MYLQTALGRRSEIFIFLSENISKSASFILLPVPANGLKLSVALVKKY